MGSNAVPESTHCEWCGAEFELGQDPPTPRTAPSKPAPVVGDEPVTHCEWCGAEYPTPGADESSGT